MTSFEFFIDAVAMLLGVVLALILTSLTMIHRKKPDGCYDDQSIERFCYQGTSSDRKIFKTH